MSGSASSQTGITYVVKLSAERLKDGEQGTVVVTLDRPALGLHLDPRCDLISFGKLTCRVTDSGRIKLLVTPKPGAPTTLTAVLSVAGDPDPKPGDNTARVQLG